jgi:hypothetical protein
MYVPFSREDSFPARNIVESTGGMRMKCREGSRPQTRPQDLQCAVGKRRDVQLEQHIVLSEMTRNRQVGFHLVSWPVYYHGGASPSLLCMIHTRWAGRFPDIDNVC